LEDGLEDPGVVEAWSFSYTRTPYDALQLNAEKQFKNG
jgi:hypothetical protein